jgi:flavin-dependent dehydrogenase
MDHNNQKTFDFIIVGAGLAGSLAAFLLHKQKYQVLLIEKQKKELKKKLCGGLLTPKSLDLLSKIFTKQEIDKLKFHYFTKAVISSEQNVLTNKVKLASIERKKLDDFILKKYLYLGGKLIDNVNFISFDFPKNTVIIKNKKYKYINLIAADGVLSLVRFQLTKKIQNRNFALETFIKNRNYNLAIEFENDLTGYNWIIPLGKSVGLGTGGVNQETKLKNNFIKFLYKENIDDPPTRGAFLPTGNDILLSRKNIYFIGDAAGLISPITGEGIYYALFSAITLVNCFKKYSSYPIKMRPIIRKIQRQLFYKKIIYNHNIRNIIFSLSPKNKLISKLTNSFVNQHLLN